MNDVSPGTTMMGIPATPIREQKLKQVALARLADMRREFKQVQREVERLSDELAALSDGDAAETPSGEDRAA